MDHSETTRFIDTPTFRNVEILAPPKREFTNAELGAIAETLARERGQSLNEFTRIVGFQTHGGRLAVNIITKGPESIVQRRATHWADAVPRSVGDSPTGYEWSIDNPENIVPVVSE